MCRKLFSMCVALVLSVLVVTAAATDITGDTADTGVYSNGDVGWAGATSERVGGSKVGSDPRGDECVIYVFQLPDLGGGEVTAANMSFYFEGTSYYVPVGNADLYGIPYRSSSSVQSGDWYQGVYDGDPGATALQDNILTPSSSVGTINSDSSGDSALVAYLNAQYNAGAVAGDYVFIRVNADTDESNDPQRYWTISMTEHGTASQRPVLTVTIGAADTTPPSPDPMTWATEPYATGDSSISMTATTATDASGVEYYFDCTAGGGNDSGWQDSPTYEDTGLSPSTTYSYQVKARDKSANQNETAYSTTESATTDAADTTPPSPDPMTWATVPYATGSSSISMTATTATDDSGVEYYFDCTTTGGHDSGWQDSATYQDTGLSPETQYSYQVKARDKSVNQNETGYSTLESATTDPPGAGNTFYCDPVSGSMANDGSSGSPWSTIQDVFDNNKIESRDRNLDPKNVGAPVKAGDTIKLRSGNHGSLYATDYCNTAHITIEKDTGHEPILTSVELRYSFNWTFRGLTVTNGQGPTGYLMQFRYDCHDLTVEDCYIYTEEDSSGWTETEWNSVSSGLWLDGVNGLAQNNTILNINMGILTSGAGTQIIGNVIQNFAQDGIRGGGSDVTLVDNDILDAYAVNENHDDGVQWYSGAGGVANNVYIEGNLVMNDTSGGTRSFISYLQGIASFDDTLDGWIVQNNIVVNAHYHGLSLYNASNSILANNTAYNPKYVAGEDECATWINFFNGGSGNTLSNNLMHSTTSGSNQQVTPSEAPSYFVNTDPANLDFHLKTDSPAIDAGTSDGAPSVDFDDQSRPQGDGYDVGAYEYTTGGDTTPPSPNPMTWATEPYATSSSSISMTATTATDASGVEYYFDCTTTGGHDSDWQDNTTYEDTGLDPNTPYTYKVKARDKSSNQNETAYSTSKSATTDPAPEWTQLTYDDFESGWGNYTDGGRDCSRYTYGTYAHQGSCAIDIQDNSGVSSSFYYTNGVDVNTPGYSQIKVEFWYYPRSMDSGEDFWVQYYDGDQWHTVATFVSGTDFSNGSFYEVKDNDVVINSSTYDFPTDMKIRFMCDAGSNTDDVYIDEVKVSAK